MKPLDYVKKYNLDKTNKFNHTDFVFDITNDFISLLELNKAENNIKGFENSLRCIKMKFDSISNKTLGVFPEKLWGFFFASVVVKLREEMCPKDMEKRRKQKEARENYRREWQRIEDEMYDTYFNFKILDFLLSLSKISIPFSDFQILGLTHECSEDDIKKAYRKLSMKYHPDKGGDQEYFIAITSAKNKCLAYLKSTK